ncbi:GNAT family N-acetyltransferase [Streptosporangium sp. NPDC000239]|uniref:GNAT family N-acetyltransferase n=1 Tax=Streptosporangium jomthongense TaxID=1193683 RepID=A0ABV8ES27_9ACTN
MRIRRYRRSDLDSVRALHQVCLAQVGLFPGDGVYYDDDLPRIEEIYLADGGEFLVGEAVEGRVMAMGALRRVDDASGEMCRLRVHPEFQRRGFGDRMVAELESRAIGLGYARLRGDTTLNQPAAIHLYRKHGWREIRREGRGEHTVVYMEKDPLISSTAVSTE